MFEQRKILERIIERHEDYSFRVKGWFATIIGAVAAALHIYHIHLEARWELPLFLCLATLGFAIWLTYHRIIVQRSISIVQKLESQTSIDKEQAPDNLEISKLLSKKIFWNDWLDAFKHPVVWLPTLVGVILLGVTYLSAPDILGSGSDLSLGNQPSPPTTGSIPPSAGEAASAAPTLLWSVFFIAMLAGCLLLLLGRGFAAKTTGMVAVLAGLLAGAHFVLVKEAKVESIFSLKNITLHINWGSTKSSPEPNPSETSAKFGAQHLGSVRNFRIGGASLTRDDFDTDADFKAAQDALTQICNKWQPLEANNALVFIIGHTDRLPLAGPTRTRYEANTGLALARASTVREWLAGNCWGQRPYTPDPENVVLLGAGPLNTPSILPLKTQTNDDCRQQTKSSGFQCDRSVDVYTLATVPVRPTMPAREVPADGASSSMKQAVALPGLSLSNAAAGERPVQSIGHSE